MVASIGVERVVEAVRHHHERWDGRGYPEGKAGTDIPLFARVIAVADSYDAIRSHRSYRPGASRDDAVQVLSDESGHQFDAEVVTAFLTTLPARGRSVAALTSLATGPGALWRYLAQLFQRFGSTALAPAIGAAGAAVIVGSSSLLNPVVPALTSPGTDVARPMASPAVSPVFAGDGSERRDRNLAAAQARADRRLVAAQARADRRRTERRKGRQAARRNEDATVVTAAGGSGSTNSAPTATQEPSISDPSTSRSAPTTDGAGTDQGTDGDPNAEGKDCAGNGNNSKGSRLHCD